MSSLPASDFHPIIQSCCPVSLSRAKTIWHFGSRNAEPLILLLAVLTRFWWLDYHSIWFDEAVSLQWASSNPAWTWAKTFTLLEDKHPPGYYLALHYWLQLLKPLDLRGNDSAVRAFGSLLGVLTVWGTLRLVRRLSGRPVALLTGLFVALCPVLVWYSQELRMFQPATTGIVWAAVCLVGAWNTPQRWPRLAWWLGFSAAMTAALYSYLFAAFVLPAAGFSMLALLWYAHREHQASDVDTHAGGGSGLPVAPFLEGVVALTITGVLSVPLAYNAWLVNSSEGEPGRAFDNFGATLAHLLRIFTVWRVDWPPILITIGLVVVGGLALVGLLLPNRHRRITSPALDRTWLWLWLGMPLLIGNLLLAQSSSVFAEDRYFIFLAPFLLWAVARGCNALSAWSRWAGATSGALTTLLLATALPHLWTPAMYRENWRAAAHYIATYQQASPALPGAVVAHVDYTRRPLERYLRPALSADELPVFFPFGGVITTENAPSTVAPPLQGIVDQGVATLWLIQSHLDGVDDQQLVEAWLNERFPLVTEQFPTGIKLSGYALQSRFGVLPALPAAKLVAAELAPGLELLACELITPTLAARDEQLHPPSGWVHVRLWWQAKTAMNTDYSARVQMVGPEGVWGERLYRDNEALRRWPTSTWRAGDIIRDEVDVNLNPVTPPGEYPIIVSALDGAGELYNAKATCGNVTITD